ncbi:hypothetical protein AXG93_4123s1190 [Marchantia polymorpha subsp. ruderalis]|uniref:Secreted protein n=1 Tax=Marchantia polymorpha subsp. ruderalis TaxID=1480154 RepID=A0A176WKF6_MARPO|nr:hypothetical protein AXG93_4123s1190 [Marchantia polymorpha subsp. ruderalis]
MHSGLILALVSSRLVLRVTSRGRAGGEIEAQVAASVDSRSIPAVEREGRVLTSGPRLPSLGRLEERRIGKPEGKEGRGEGVAEERPAGRAWVRDTPVILDSLTATLLGAPVPDTRPAPVPRQGVEEEGKSYSSSLAGSIGR